MDNQGSYLLVSGCFEAGGMALASEPRELQGKQVVMRMVFSDIGERALRWRWQRSEDEGESWNDLWTIRYQRTA